MNFGRAAVPQNFDVKCGRSTSGRNFHFIFSVSRSHSLTHSPSAGVLWGREQPVAETSPWQYTTHIRDRHTCPRRDSNPQTQQANGRRPTPKNEQPSVSAALSYLLNAVLICYCHCHTFENSYIFNFDFFVYSGDDAYKHRQVPPLGRNNDPVISTRAHHCEDRRITISCAAMAAASRGMYSG